MPCLLQWYVSGYEFELQLGKVLALCSPWMQFHCLYGRCKPKGDSQMRVCTWSASALCLLWALRFSEACRGSFCRGFKLGGSCLQSWPSWSKTTTTTKKTNQKLNEKAVGRAGSIIKLQCQVICLCQPVCGLQPARACSSLVCCGQIWLLWCAGFWSMCQLIPESCFLTLAVFITESKSLEGQQVNQWSEYFHEVILQRFLQMKTQHHGSVFYLL